jgi:hypothetical protein
VSGFFFQVFREVDDHDGFKRTLLDTDATTNAKFLTNPCNLGVGSYFDAELANLDDWATLLAFLAALFGFASAEERKGRGWMMRIPRCE